ncbi:MAG TPA: HTTM domain-containing protein, partial [Enhygromyxa sp.]|nr:HTTM domain-containing protein [Enhygromyxa sp.]
ADRLASFSMNKLALVAWLILLLAPWPTDSTDEPTSSEAESAPLQLRSLPQLRSAWPLRILQATLLLQYFGAGVCKLRGGWLSSSEVLWLQAQDVYMTDLSAWTVRELPDGVWAGLQYGALAFELLAPILLGVRRLRPLGFAWGLVMHLGIGLMMYRVGYFSLSVVAYYVLFADERHLLALRQRLRGS